MWRCSGGRSKGSKTETLHWTLEEKMQLFFFPCLNNIKVNITVTPLAFCLEARDSQRHARWPARRSRLGSGASYRVPLVYGPRGVEQEPRSAAPPPTLRLTHPKAPAGLANHGPLIPSRGRERGARHRSSLLSSLRLPRPSVL